MTPSTETIRAYWGLDPSVEFLNHGSFGACPKPVLAVQSEYRARLEAEPVRFLVREVPPLLDAARAALGVFLGADFESLAWIQNATTGVNIVLRSLRFSPGDEILVSDQEYNACRNIVDYVAETSGARAVVVKIPFPLDSPDQVFDAVMAALTPRTRFVLIDHITSQTGLVFPIERIVRAVRERGIDVMVDGAHAPGMVPLRIDELGAPFYTGNCHKWMCTPKGSAFLYVDRRRQKEIRPLVVSHGANERLTTRSRFRAEFEWMGTGDPTPFLCVPEAIRFLGGLLPGGWDALRSSNRDLALAARRLIAAATGIPSPAPDSMIGSLAAFRIPDMSAAEMKAPQSIDPFQDALFARGFELPVNVWPAPPVRYARIAAQIYNSLDQYERLARVLRELRG